MGGMSEYSMMTAPLPWWVSYPLFLLGLTGIGFVTWRVLGRWMDRSMSGTVNHTAPRT
jgi:magnesium transporter